MIKGNQVKLRLIKESDINAVNLWRNDLRNKILAQGFRLPVSLELDKVWYEEKIISGDNKNIYFIVAEISTDNPVGIIQLNNIDYISGTATWGFIIGEKSHRGKGIETEAPRLLLNYAYNILNLRKLVGYTLSIRPGIQRLFSRVGKVKEEGILKRHYFFNGIYYDVHILSFFKEDFEFLKNDYPI
jgi:ribosomal-protein-alanine N-acetyltransferase